MARSRTVKPSFFKDGKLYDAERQSGFPLRVAYEALWCQADREGRFEWKPRELKLDCLPYDDVDFADVLDALAAAGFLLKYEVEGRTYGLIPNLKRHQHFHKNETPSTLPAPPEHRTSTTHAPDKHRSNPPDTDTDTDTDSDADAVGDAPDAAAAARDWIPPAYHDELDRALTICGSPASLLAELKLLRDEPEARNLKGVTGEHVGMALRDALMKRVQLSGKSLAGFIRIAQRAPPAVVGSIEQAVEDHDREREERRQRHAAGQ